MNCYICGLRLDLRGVHLWTLDCDHEFHTSCLLRRIPRTCPVCNFPLSRAERQRINEENEEMISGQYSRARDQYRRDYEYKDSGYGTG